MKPNEIRSLEAACLWAHAPEAPPEAKVLLGEIERREGAWTGNEGWLYETPPEDRIHTCMELNPAQVPVAWVEYDEEHEFELLNTNVYGDGGITKINFCPFCGEKLCEPSE